MRVIAEDGTVLIRYSPDQERDDHGRFAGGGSGDGGGDGGSGAPAGTGGGSGEFDARFNAAAGGRDALFGVDHVMDRPPGDEKIGQYDGRVVYRAFRDYTGQGPGGFETVNGELRSGNPSESTLAAAAKMDAAFSESHAISDLAVYRGIDDPEAVFGDSWSREGDLTGMQWKDAGYTSTTADHAQASTFTLDGGVSMNVLVPEGSSAVTVSGMDKEAEILLPRDSTFEVVADHGWYTNQLGENVRGLDVKVVP